MRVLFTSTSGWGHIHPMVPLAQAFLDRGDDVMWATADEVRTRLEREGIRTSAAGLDDGVAMSRFYEQYPEVHAVAPPERSDFMFPRLFGPVRAQAMLDDLLPVAQAWSPDLVVCDAAEFAGPVAAAVVSAPNITLSFGALLPEPRVAATGAEVAPLWTAQGLEPRPYGGVYDNLYLDIYPSSMQPAERPHLAATQPLRPGVFATGEDEPLPDWVTAPSSDPLVYVTLGTVFSNDEVLSTVVGAIRELAMRVVVTVGPRGEPRSLGPQPDDVHVARYIPQTQLLEHCAVVVSHGGSGTLLASLAAELPQLCIPQAADQFFNAASCARAGAGLALEPGRCQPTASATRSSDSIPMVPSAPRPRTSATRSRRCRHRPRSRTSCTPATAEPPPRQRRSDHRVATVARVASARHRSRGSPSGRHPTRGRPATLSDNPHLNMAEYRETLDRLNPVTRAQLRDGDWDIRPEGRLFQRHWFPTVDANVVDDDADRVRYWDLAATPERPGADPDYSVGVLLAKDSTGRYSCWT